MRKRMPAASSRSWPLFFPKSLPLPRLLSTWPACCWRKDAMPTPMKCGRSPRKCMHRPRAFSKWGLESSAPRILQKGEPEYSEEARKARLPGSILIRLVVDASGMPTQIAVVRPLGLGLDDKAVEAVQQWRFAPATKGGAAVPVLTQIEIMFHLL